MPMRHPRVKEERKSAQRRATAAAQRLGRERGRLIIEIWLADDAKRDAGGSQAICFSEQLGLGRDREDDHVIGLIRSGGEEVRAFERSVRGLDDHLCRRQVEADQDVDVPGDLLVAHMRLSTRPYRERKHFSSPASA